MIAQARMGQLYLLVGPPGVGKNALMKIALDRFPDLTQLPTATTRDPRPGEQEGREHYFINHDTFHQWIAEDRLIEYQVIHNGNYYGTPRHTVEQAIQERRDRIADIEVLGANQLRQHYPDNTVLIFIQPPSREDLIERMRQRGENEASIAARMQRVDMEMQYAPLCDYLITNDDLDHAGRQLTSIIEAERSHRDLLNLRVARGLPRRPVRQSATLLLLNEQQVAAHRQSGALPTSDLVSAEAPGDAALRALRRTTNSLQEAALTLVGCTVDDHHPIEHVTFYFIYPADDDVALQPDWRWESVESISLPGTIRAAIEQHPRSALELEWMT